MRDAGAENPLRGNLLEFRELSFALEGGRPPATQFCALNFQVAPGEAVALLGETGSGKSALFKAVFGLHPRGNPVRSAGAWFWEGRDVLDLKERDRRNLLARDIAFALSERTARLDPHVTVHKLLVEGPVHRLGLSRRHATLRGIETAAALGLDLTSEMLRRSPRELTPGLRQLLSNAIALSCSPKLLVVDGGHRGLTAAHLARFRQDLQRRVRESKLAVVWLTNDIEEAAVFAKRIVLLTDGTLVPLARHAPGAEQAHGPEHPPGIADAIEAADTLRHLTPPPLRVGPVVPSLTAEHLTLVHSIDRPWPRPPTRKRILDDVSLTLLPGQCLGVVGTTGSGKSALAHLLTGEKPATYGALGGAVFAEPHSRDPGSRRVQRVGDEDGQSLDPQLLVSAAITLGLHDPEPERLEEVARDVGLDSSKLSHRIFELGTGDKRLVALARALIRRPRVLILDEPMAGLSPLSRLRLVELLARLQEDEGVSCLVFSSGDAELLRPLCHHLAFLLNGRIVELGPTDVLLGAAAHPYTLEMTREKTSPGPSLLSALHARTGCDLAPLCPRASASGECSKAVPRLHRVGERHAVACWNPSRPE